MHKPSSLITIVVLATLAGLLASLNVLVWADQAGDLREALATSHLVLGAAVLGTFCTLLLLAFLVWWFRTSEVPWILLGIGVHVLVPSLCYYYYRTYTSTSAHIATLVFGVITLCPWLWIDIGLLQGWYLEKRTRTDANPGHARGPFRQPPVSLPSAQAIVQVPLAEEIAAQSRLAAPRLPSAASVTSSAESPTAARVGAHRQLRWEGEESRGERRQRDYAHAKACESARRVMLRDDWLVIDTETTGLEEHDEVIGIVLMDSTGTLVYASPIRPQATIHADASAVHGRTISNLADAPRFPEIWPRLRAVLHGHTLIAYDAKFDRRMLEQTTRRYGLALPPIRWRCAMNLYARFWGEPLLPHGYRSQQLAVACRRLGIPVGSRRAADQCRATLVLLRAIAGCERESSG